VADLLRQHFTVIELMVDDADATFIEVG
jgi:hypothetical protein